MALRSEVRDQMLRVAVLVGGSFVGSGLALAGGFTHQQGATGLGTSFSGASATASDPTTLFYNPAGMNSLPEGQNFSASAVYLNLRNNFRDSGSTDASGKPMSGGDGGNFGTKATIPNLYYVYNTGALAYGIGVSVPYAMQLSYEPNWKGRYQFTSGQFVVTEVAPAISYRVNDQWSFGASVGYQSLSLELGSKINNFNVCYGSLRAKGLAEAAAATNCASQASVEGESKIKGTSKAPVLGLGVLFKPAAGWNVGFNFRTASKHQVKGTVEYKNTSFFAASKILTNGDVEGKSVMPGSGSLAVAHTHDALTLSADVTYTAWSSVKELAYDFADSTPTKVTSLNWRNTVRAGAGAVYRVTSQVPVRVGYAFDQSPTPDAAHRVASLPDSDRHVIGLGAGYELDKYKINLGISDVIVKNAPTDTSATTGEKLKGDFRNGNLMSFGIQVDYVL
ncbi:MAG: hypothetical protein RL011_2140 [Pseudomonadota bacterium]|jgi:long-chain fatty acid transport protein